MEEQATENNSFAAFSPYLFVRIGSQDRTKVLQSPGVLAIMGKNPEQGPILNAEIEFLHSDLCRQSIEPFHEFVIGNGVRILSGVMSGVGGTLVSKGASMRLVLALDLINQHSAIQADADSLEPVRA